MKKSIYSTKDETLRAWLKEERTRQGLTMRQLAEKLDVPHSFIGKVEQGERRLDIIEYSTYCKALGIDAKHGLSLIA